MNKRMGDLKGGGEASEARHLKVRGEAGTGCTITYPSP